MESECYRSALPIFEPIILRCWGGRGMGVLGGRRGFSLSLSLSLSLCLPPTFFFLLPFPPPNSDHDADAVFLFLTGLHLWSEWRKFTVLIMQPHWRWSILGHLSPPHPPLTFFTVAWESAAVSGLHLSVHCRPPCVAFRHLPRCRKPVLGVRSTEGKVCWRIEQLLINS